MSGSHVVSRVRSTLGERNQVINYELPARNVLAANVAASTVTLVDFCSREPLNRGGTFFGSTPRVAVQNLIPVLIAPALSRDSKALRILLSPFPSEPSCLGAGLGVGSKTLPFLL